MRLVLLALLSFLLTACSIAEQPDSLFEQERVARGQYVAARLMDTEINPLERDVRVTVGDREAEVVSFNENIVVFEIPRLEPGEEELEPPLEVLEVVITDGENEAADSIEVAGEVFPDKAIALLEPGTTVGELQETLSEAVQAFEELDGGIFANLQDFEGFQIADVEEEGLIEEYPIFIENPRPMFEPLDFEELQREAAQPLQGGNPCAGELALLDFGGAPLAEALEALEEVDPDLPIDGDSTGSGSQTPIDYLEAVNAYQAFETELTGAETTVAVLDTGVNEVEELSGRLLVGLGYDFVNADFDATDDDYVDPLTGTRLHGTPIAVLAAGEQSGVAPQAEILPIKVCDEEGNCKASQVVLGVCHALVYAPQGPENLVLNMSLGGPVQVDILGILLDFAINRLGTLVAASAGNEGEAAQQVSHYPASFPIEGLVAVGALELEEEGGDWQAWVETQIRGTSWGDYVDLSAPGKDLLGGYTGTSFSTPLVAGTMALMREADRSAPPAQVEGCLTSTAQSPPTPSLAVGAGMLDVAAALQACTP